MVPSEAQKYLDSLPESERKKLAIDEKGNLVANNRAFRRRKIPSDPKYTKATHSLKKQREKARASSKRHKRPAEA